MENKTTEKLEQRLYILSVRGLSGIYKGCQATHTTESYAKTYHNEPDFIKHIDEDKTVIMLDGGTHQDMVAIVEKLTAANVHHTYFLEPDLNYCMTSIAFLVDERIWGEGQESVESAFDWAKANGFGSTLCESWVEHVGGWKNSKIAQIIQGKRLSN